MQRFQRVYAGSFLAVFAALAGCAAKEPPPSQAPTSAQVAAEPASQTSAAAASPSTDAPPQTETQVPGDCQLPPKVGPCKAAMSAWHFDAASGKCQPFTYGGCEGNANNFKTEGACAAACTSK